MFHLHHPLVITRAGNENAASADVIWVEVSSAGDLTAHMGRHRILFLVTDLAESICALPESEIGYLLLGAVETEQLWLIRRDCPGVATLASQDEVDRFDLLAEFGLQRFYNSPARAMA